MRVLVTGANGFIGSQVVETLVRANREVIAFCEYNSFSSRGWLDKSELAGDFQSIFGDIRDSELVWRSIQNVDAVLHLAALIAIPFSYEAPRSYLQVNTIGTLNVLEAVRENEIPLVHTSTSEVYGTPQTIPITENHRLNPQSPYAASKAAADHLVQSYVRSFGLRALIMRPFNTYGPRQSARAIIPTIMSQALKGDVITLGNLAPQRDLTYVADTALAFECALRSEGIFDGRVVQLGYGKAMSVRDLVEVIAGVVGKKLSVKKDSDRLRPAKSEVDLLLSDPTNAQEVIGWKAGVSLNDGLKMTWEWVQENREVFERNSGYVI